MPAVEAPHFVTVQRPISDCRGSLRLPGAQLKNGRIDETDLDIDLIDFGALRLSWWHESDQCRHERDWKSSGLELSDSLSCQRSGISNFSRDGDSKEPTAGAYYALAQQIREAQERKKASMPMEERIKASIPMEKSKADNQAEHSLTMVKSQEDDHAKHSFPMQKPPVENQPEHISLPMEQSEAHIKAEHIRLHAVGQCNPCHYMSTRGFCKREMSCSFCHEPHEQKKQRPRKARRQFKKKVADSLEIMGYDGKVEGFEQHAESLIKQGQYMSAVVKSKLKELAYMVGVDPDISRISKEVLARHQEGDKRSESNNEFDEDGRINVKSSSSVCNRMPSIIPHVESSRRD